MSVIRNAEGKVIAVDFKKVREKVDLNWFFEKMIGAKAKPMSGRVRYAVCPNQGCKPSSVHSVKVSVSGDGWSCFSCGKGGDVVQAAAYLWGMELKDAGLELMKADAEMLQNYVPPVVPEAVQRDDAALGIVLAKVAEALTYPSKEALAYLASRGISERVAREACERGIMMTLPNDPFKAKSLLCDIAGQELMMKAGLWKPDKKAPACAFRPLWFRSQSHCAAEFRLMRKPVGEEKKAMRYGGKSPWIWEGELANEWMLVEGPIDLLSAVELGSKRTIFGLPGCENWEPEWFSIMAGQNVLVALDPDKPGYAALENLKPVLEAYKCKVGIYSPPNRVGDLNEELKAKLGLPD